MVEKNDFVEIQFTGRTSDGKIFDTNIDSDAKLIGAEQTQKPLIICIGKRMILDGIDEFLDKKELGVEYTLNLSPEKAFGLRDKNLIKLMPAKSFLEKKINPKPGMVLSLDNYLVRIVAVSGGRVLVDFNNPLSGKDVSYTLKIIRKVEDINEQIKSISLFFFKQEIDFEIKNKKVLFKLPEFYLPLVKKLGEEFDSILSLEISLEPINLGEINHNHEHHDHHDHEHDHHDHNHEHHDHPEHNHKHNHEHNH
jgi:FKBP-type peptidyl-prolyl cis-trans isomerase 2